MRQIPLHLIEHTLTEHNLHANGNWMLLSIATF